VFLANTAPNLQSKVLKQIAPPRLAMLDTMNLWIDVARKDLLAVLKRIDGIVLNDEEARMLTGERSLLRAARKVLDLGPRFAVLKKGEHGAFLIGKNVHYALPAYPVDDVIDPTGAGDSFAGGFLGYLASVENVEPPTLRRAMIYGTVTASFCVEGFGIEKLAKCDRSALESRVNEFLSIVT
jgi:sugar/nucleoside kinase (ribokinase family)